MPLRGDTTWISANLSVGLVDNYDKFKYTAPSNLPRVRTCIREYLYRPVGSPLAVGVGVAVGVNCSRLNRRFRLYDLTTTRDPRALQFGAP